MINMLKSLVETADRWRMLTKRWNSQIEILKIEKSVVTELKNSFNGLIRQLVITEERINELEDKPTEIIQTESQSKNRVRKKPNNNTKTRTS